MELKEIEGNLAGLARTIKTGQFDLASCEFAEATAGSEQARGCWSWPARVS